MTRVVIRVDASLLMGSGHVMRCRTLARQLRRNGADVLLICRRQPGDLIALLEQEFAVLALPELFLRDMKHSESPSSDARQLYLTWLGCTQDQDAAESLAILAEAGLPSPDWLVVDHYGLDACWQQRFLDGLSPTSHIRLLVIDDLADRQHIADILLDQNFFAGITHQRYQGLLPKKSIQLLGPKYALLSSEYAILHPLLPVRTTLRRILIFFGGVDADNATSWALRALMDPRFAHLEVDVVLGHHAPHRVCVAELVTQRPLTTLHEPLPSLAGLMARADLAIGAGGSTTWERACLGLPSIVLTLSANQSPINHALASEQLIVSLSASAMEQSTSLHDALLMLLNDSGHCLSLSQASREMVDGRGAQRVVDAMSAYPASLREQ